MSDEPHNNVVYVRVTDTDQALLDEVMALMPALKKSDVLRAALRVGARALREDPALALGQPQVRPGRKPR